MLVLTRTADGGDRSVLQIGDDIQVVVTAVHGDSVRLGIVAPRHVTVDRSEIAVLKAADLATLPSELQGVSAPK